MIILKKPKIISFTALKGGTGKTLITFNVASLLVTKYRKKVLVIDIDPQHNLSNLLYKKIKRRYRTTSNKPIKIPEQFEHEVEYTAEDIFESNKTAYGVVKNSHINKLDIVPTTISMTAIELQISGIAGRELIIKNWLYDNQDYLKSYDYIFFDTNPTLSIVNTNAFLCCDNIILTSDVDADSINAIGVFMELYYPIQQRIDREAKDNITGLLVNKIKEGNNMNKDFLEYVESDSFMFSDILLKTKIHDAVSIAETKINRQPISSLRNERSYNEFIALIDELLERSIL